MQPPDTTPWQEENRSLTLALQRHLYDDRYEESLEKLLRGLEYPREENRTVLHHPGRNKISEIVTGVRGSTKTNQTDALGRHHPVQLTS